MKRVRIDVNITCTRRDDAMRCKALVDLVQNNPASKETIATMHCMASEADAVGIGATMGVVLSILLGIASDETEGECEIVLVEQGASAPLEAN